MAATSIKVEAETKRLLDDLQADLTRETGRKVTLQELTRALAEMASENRSRLIATFVDRPRRLTKAQVDRLLALRIDAPIDVKPEELDDFIYGFPYGTDEPATPGAERLARRLRAARRKPAPKQKGRRRRR